MDRRRVRWLRKRHLPDDVENYMVWRQAGSTGWRLACQRRWRGAHGSAQNVIDGTYVDISLSIQERLFRPVRESLKQRHGFLARL